METDWMAEDRGGEEEMSEGACLTCTVLGCQGLQYNPYRQEFYCPVFDKVWTTDNKTIKVYTPNTVTTNTVKEDD